MFNSVTSLENWQLFEYIHMIHRDTHLMTLSSMYKYGYSTIHRGLSFIKSNVNFLNEFIHPAARMMTVTASNDGGFPCY